MASDASISANAGRLDRRIEIQRATEVQDSFGQVTQTWVLHATVWANFLPAGGAESFTADQRSSRSGAVFTIRYLAGITPRMRVKMGSEIWEIEEVSEPTRRRWLVLTCHAFEVESGG